MKGMESSSMGKVCIESNQIMHSIQVSTLPERSYDTYLDKCPRDIIGLIYSFIPLCYIRTINEEMSLPFLKSYLEMRYDTIPWIMAVDFEVKSTDDITLHERIRGYNIKYRSIFGIRMFLGYRAEDVYQKNINVSIALGYDEADTFITRNNMKHGKIPWKRLLGCDVHIREKACENQQCHFGKSSQYTNIKSAILTGTGGSLVEHVIKYHGEFKDLGKCVMQCKVRILENYRGVSVDVRPLLERKAERGYTKIANVFLVSKWKNNFESRRNRENQLKIFKVLKTCDYWPISRIV